MGWKLTSTTWKCDHVADFATIMLYPDTTTKCSYVNRYSNAENAKEKMKNCKWPDCPLVAEFALMTTRFEIANQGRWDNRSLRSGQRPRNQK